MQISEYILEILEKDNKEPVFSNAFLPLTSTFDCLSSVGKYGIFSLKIQEDNRSLMVAYNLETDEEDSFIFLDTPEKVILYKFDYIKEEKNQ